MGVYGGLKNSIEKRNNISILYTQTGQNLFIFFVIKMILHQNDYIVIDIEKRPWSVVIREGKENQFDSVYFTFTIQINGKIKIVKFNREIVDWEVENYEIIYHTFRMLNDLGYNVPLDMEVNELVNKAIA